MEPVNDLIQQRMERERVEYRQDGEDISIEVSPTKISRPIIRRRAHPHPPPVLWFAIIIFVFLATVGGFADFEKAVFDEGFSKGVIVGNSFKQVQINTLADLLQIKNPKLYRAKALHYAKLIYNECERQGVGHTLLVALMIQESGLNEFATGKAGEIGLMQIMPWWLDKWQVLGLPQISAQELYDPVNNIRWGVTILKRSLGNTDGNIFKALCFYNAGGNWKKGIRYAESILGIRSNLEN